jgi:tetratricopeptide (TPR) repeat protein
MQRLVREQKIPYRSQRYQQALKIYRDNLREIVDLAGDNQIPLFFGELVSNLADQPPFISLEDEQAEKRLKKKVKNLNQLQLQTLLQQDSTLAMLYYHSGVHFEKEGRYAEAHQHYLRAKDLDLLRFRASEDFNQVLHNLSKAQHVYLVPLLTTYRQQSPHGLIGDSLMTDHLHPTIRGNQLIAAAFYQALQSKMDQFALDSSRLSTETNYFERSGVTLLDQWVANFRITVLTKGWPFVEQSQIAAFVDGFQPENYLQTTGFTLWKDEINWLEAHLNMALHYEKSGALEAALEEYAAISKAFPFDEEMLNQQGRLLIALGRINDARSILETSHSKKPTNFAARMLGAILTQQRDLPTGIGYLKIAVDLNPRDVQSLYNLAGAYYMSGAYNQALDMLDKLLSIDPGNQEAKVLLQQVKTRAGVE